MNFKVLLVQTPKGETVRSLINMDHIQEIAQSDIIGHTRFVIVDTGGQLAYDVVMSLTDAIKEFGNTNIMLVN